MGAAACSEKCHEARCQGAVAAPPRPARRCQSSRLTFVESVRVLSSPMEEEVVPDTNPRYGPAVRGSNRPVLANEGEASLGDLAWEPCVSDVSDTPKSDVTPVMVHRGSEHSMFSELEVPESPWAALPNELGNEMASFTEEGWFEARSPRSPGSSSLGCAAEDAASLSMQRAA